MTKTQTQPVGATLHRQEWHTTFRRAPTTVSLTTHYPAKADGGMKPLPLHLTTQRGHPKDDPIIALEYSQCLDDF